jgi:hypothetical protein
MDENIEQRAVAKAIQARLLNTPDDYYIHDSGKVLYALLAGTFVSSLDAPEGTNFHLMQPTDIAQLIHAHLNEKLG